MDSVTLLPSVINFDTESIYVLGLHIGMQTVLTNFNAPCAYSIVNSELLTLLGMPTIGSEDCLQVLKHPQKCPSASEAACCLWRTVPGLWVCVLGETSRTLEKRLSEHKNVVKKHDSNNGIATHAWTYQHQQWTGRHADVSNSMYLHVQIFLYLLLNIVYRDHLQIICPTYSCAISLFQSDVHKWNNDWEL